MTATFGTPARFEAILCDADGNLFDSEPPAFDASAQVTNRFLESLGLSQRFSGDDLRRQTTGKSFRTTACELAAAAGVAPPGGASLERWVAQERDAVTAHLASTLRPDAAVTEPLRALAAEHRLAVVSSSATSRVSACLAAAGLDVFFEPHEVFSAEDSLTTPQSKPSPAIYRLAARRLGLRPQRALAVEDSGPGVQAAVAAGHPTVGNVQFVPVAERAGRVEELLAAGAQAVVSSWARLPQLLSEAAGDSPRDVLAEATP